MPQDASHSRCKPSEWDRWHQKTALLGFKSDEKCLFPMLFFVLGSRLSGAIFCDITYFGGDNVAK